MSKLFPDGFDAALKELLRVLGTSEDSYKIDVFRYEGEADYQARINITHMASSHVVRGE